MDCFVTARAPAGALPQPRGMIRAADDDSAPSGLLLEMALEAKTRVAGDQHFLVHRTMHLMAARAAFPQRFVLKHERAELHRVTLAAGFVFRKQRRPAC